MSEHPKTDQYGGHAIGVKAIASEFSIPVPPIPEQSEIVRRVKALLLRADRLETRYSKSEGAGRQNDPIRPCEGVSW
jgi:hypothetical protein